MSLGLLTPFLLLIFNQTDILKKSDGKSGFPANVLNWFNSLMSQWAETTPGKIKALSAICIIVVISILLKNLFLYLAMYVLNPIRNRIINDMRSDMFGKILMLPIGYFNEQKKGDIMSRLTNDLQDVEYSTVSFLESFFREPITIVLYLDIWCTSVHSFHYSLFSFCRLPDSSLDASAVP